MTDVGSQLEPTKLSLSAILVIAANTMNGPGLTTLPTVARSAGTVMYTILVILATIVTSYVIRRLCTVMWSQHKTHHHSPVLEESDLVALSGDAWPRNKARSRRIASMSMVGCALALALAQMMLCAKIADAMIIASFGSACGISPNVLGGNFVHCTKNLSMKPFVPELVIAEDHDFVSPSNADYSKVHVPEKPKVSAPPMTLITLGLLISATITISLASVDQSSMITAQYVLFGFLLLACASFCRTLHLQSASTSSSNQNDCHQKPDMILGPRPFDAMGPVLFNFAFVVTAPPLSCGAQGLNGAIQALTIAIVVMGTLYLIVGWFGAPAAVCAGSGDDTNLLSLVLKGGSVVDIASTITFGLSQLAAIPVYCELARETMDTHIQAVLPKTSFWLCHVAPWAICAITYNSELFESFVEWSSLLLLGFCNFSLPLLIELTLKEQKTSTTNLMIRRAPGQGPDPVLWVYALVSSSIMAVIVQRISDNILLSEMAFMITLLSIFYYY